MSFTFSIFFGADQVRRTSTTAINWSHVRSNSSFARGKRSVRSADIIKRRSVRAAACLLLNQTAEQLDESMDHVR